MAAISAGAQFSQSETDRVGKRQNGGVECGSGSGVVQKWPRRGGKERERGGRGRLAVAVLPLRGREGAVGRG